jgi:hypothetical protein
MRTSAEAAKNTVEFSKKHIRDQWFRIERQRGVVASLERADNPDLVVKARQILTDMEKTLTQMEDDYSAARERLAQATTNEKRQRDTSNVMDIKELIEALRNLPKGGQLDLQQSELETIFRDSDPVGRALSIAGLSGCTFKLDPSSGLGTFTRVK